ncbi:MAG: AraC family transcriptional regulator [Lachnospiraceae bacterium]|nr:AraC family transcriptional regulator [Lachnospiraceae bacterium]
MENVYKILNSDNVFLPKEICYLNFKHFFMEYHQHSEGSIELNYIVDGDCMYDIDGKIFNLTKRSLILVNGNVPHRVLISTGCILMSINCTQESMHPCFGTIKDLLSAYPELSDIFEHLTSGIHLNNAKLLYPLLQCICNVYDNPKESSPMLRSGLSFVESNDADYKRDFPYLNLLVNKALIDISKLYTNAEPSVVSLYVEKIKHFISYHFFEITSIDQIAEHIALNKIYMQKIFKQETGMTLWSYLTKFRMQKAVHYLSFTNIPIGDIDEMLGINSRQNFYLLFKKEYGMSPSEYRKSHYSVEKK